MNFRAGRCLVMGIVNRTPDSFYDGGRVDLGEATQHAVALIEQGADVIDLGGVKAGPGEEVSAEEEMERLLPLVEALAQVSPVPLSVETGSPEIARRALELGATIVNDVTGLNDPDLASVCAEAGASLVLMHHGGQLRGRPRHPRYSDIVEDVTRIWGELAQQALDAGVAEENIVVDPGLDFGKTTFHSLELMQRFEELTATPWPVLVAPSRKDVVGETLALPPEHRLEGTLAIVAVAVTKGAAAVRVHDVQETVRVVRMIEAIAGVRPPAVPVRGLWD